jgi:hypothetical protein
VHAEALRRGFRDQPRGEVAVDLDDGQVANALEQRMRERAQAGADLDDVVVWLRIERGENALDGAPVDQEVLAEALSRDVTATPPSRG